MDVEMVELAVCDIAVCPVLKSETQRSMCEGTLHPMLATHHWSSEVGALVVCAAAVTSRLPHEPSAHVPMQLVVTVSVLAMLGAVARWRL